MNKQENNKTEEVIFDETEFDDIEVTKKHGKKWMNGHTIFFAIVACLFLFAIVRLLVWNKGQKSDYDPTQNNTEFDTEPLDYIQPLSKNQLAGKPDDGVTTMLCLGNAPFADNGEENELSSSLAKIIDGVTVNASFGDSFQSLKNASYDSSYPNDGVSLYHVTKALVTGDFSTLTSAASAISAEASKKASYLQTIDMSKIDVAVIMYDISDYIDLRPVVDPNDENNLVTYCGSLNASIKLIQEKYPYIRIVVLSTPASGKTIDDFYVDGATQDLGNGTLTDYMGHEANVAMSNGVSYIDTYFGVINVENRSELLVNDYHLNKKGSEAIAERFNNLISLN